jgi:rubredoxin
MRVSERERFRTKQAKTVIIDVLCLLVLMTQSILFFGELIMQYECQNCAYIYDPEVGDSEGEIEPGRPFEEIPEDWCALSAVLLKVSLSH